MHQLTSFDGPWVLPPVWLPVLSHAPPARRMPHPGDGLGGAPAPALTTSGSEEAFARYQQRMEQDWQARLCRQPISGTQRISERPPLGTPVPPGDPVDTSI